MTIDDCFFLLGFDADFFSCGSKFVFKLFKFRFLLFHFCVIISNAFQKVGFQLLLVFEGIEDKAFFFFGTEVVFF